jgi:hypothetical protein
MSFTCTEYDSAPIGKGGKMTERKSQRITPRAQPPFLHLDHEVSVVRPIEVVDGQIALGQGIREERLALTGQEFLRFRGLWTEEDVAAFAAEFGHVRVGPVEVGLWRQDPQMFLAGMVEGPAADWIKLSGLMDYAVGLWELVQEDTRREDVLEALDGLDGVVRPQDWTILRDDYPGHPWIAGILGGLARMGLLVRREGDELTFTRTSALPDSGVLLGVHWHEFQPLTITPEGVVQALASVVSPKLENVNATLVANGTELSASLDVPSDLLSLMWLQLVNAIDSRRPLKVCAFKGCPGPPARPRVFLWRWGDSSRRRTDAIYCHPACANAASVRRSRANKKED